jgi:hypothetical protein
MDVGTGGLKEIGAHAKGMEQRATTGQRTDWALDDTG